MTRNLGIKSYKMNEYKRHNVDHRGGGFFSTVGKFARPLLHGAIKYFIPKVESKIKNFAKNKILEGGKILSNFMLQKAKMGGATGRGVVGVRVKGKVREAGGARAKGKGRRVAGGARAVRKVTCAGRGARRAKGKVRGAGRAKAVRKVTGTGRGVGRGAGRGAGRQKGAISKKKKKKTFYISFMIV